MTGSRKVLLAILALAVPAYFLPATRDELSWCWTQSHNHSDNYLRYLSDWPHGRHVIEARLLCQERRREEIKRDQIRTAPSTDADAEAAYVRDREIRRDNFQWKKTTITDTLASYHDYLLQYPQGRHAVEARQKIQTLDQQATETNATPR